MNLLVGKYRRLQQISRNGFFKVIALDHRDVFVNMLATSGKKHEVEDVIEEKLNIIRLCNRNVSGYLVDTEYGLPKCLLDDAIGGDVGFMVSYEDNDYSIENFSEDYFVKDFTVEQVKSLGASVLKVFLYFDPNSKYADKQLRIVK